MQLTRREIDSVLILSFAEKVHLEGEDSLRFKEKIRGLIEEGRWNLVVDLSGVEFIDSSGLGALISALKVLRANGGDLRLAAIPPNVRVVLEITRLHDVFAVYPTVQDALRAAREEEALVDGGRQKP